MTHFVADIGNSRIKWGRCDERRVLDSASLPLDDPAAWDEQARRWQVGSADQWTLAGVNPEAVERLAKWLTANRHSPAILASYQDIPIKLAVEHPETVGLDRLLNAVAANERRFKDRPAIVIDAGSAVTVDWVDAEGVFQGGAIFPGLRLMAKSLHNHTAQLPCVEIAEPIPSMPGRSTVPAIQAGIFGAVVGGIRYLARQLAAESSVSPVTFLTGGDAELLAAALKPGVEVWPSMTLEGIRITAKARFLP